MLPALAVHTPRLSSSFDASAMRIARAADLERSDRLQVLELEVDLRLAVGAQAHERRADRGARDALARRLDLVERDHRVRSSP
jgi:hypothetical protein